MNPPQAAPLLRVRTELRRTFAVLGIPTTFETNAQAVLDIVQQTFGDWRVLDQRPDLLEDQHATVRIAVHEEGRFDGWTYTRGPGHLFIGHDGRFALCDPERRLAFAVVPAGDAAHQHQFRYAVVEALTFGLLTPLGRPPLHAAAVTRAGNTVLLAGPSGAGKSTLAYALGRQGCSILSDDSSYLQAEPLRVWGMPRHLHISADAVRFFPELAQRRPQILANGKTKIVVDARAEGLATELPVASSPRIVLLDRSRTGPALEPIEPLALVEEMLGRGDEGFDAFASELGPLLEQLAAGGAWRLYLGSNPNDHLALLPL